jgi:ABC-2 type transport system ATP-binding protein
LEDVLRLLVARASEDGATVFFSSHQLHEVEQIADYITIVEKGRHVISGYLDDLKTSFRRVNLVFDGEPPEPAFWESGATSMYRNGRTMSLLASHGVDEIVQQARSMNAASVEVETVSLKEIFMNVARQGGRQ